MASSSSFSSNSSTPVVVETPENQIIDQISGVASGLAQQMLQWGQSVFAQTSAVTSQAVGNFFNVSQQMQGLSNNLTDQYNNTFAPENQQLVDDANSYNSVARQKVDMGAAGATQAQAGDAAIKNSEEDLRSYGIDPSSGRYAALDKAAAVQNAANVAGAENMQRDRDIQTGQALRSQAVQVGAQLPAAIANVNNTEIQANTGASNASLANANTGANLMKLPNDYLGTAMGVKLPPTGQQSSGSSTGQSQSPDKNSNPSNGAGQGGGQGAGSGGQGGQPWMPQHGSGQPTAGGGGGSGGRINLGSAAGITNIPGNSQDWSDPTGQNYDGTAGIDPNSFQDGYNEGGTMGVGQPGFSDDGISGLDNPFSDSGFGQTVSGGGFGGADQNFGGLPDDSGISNSQWGNIGYDPSQNDQGGAADWSQSYDQPAPTDWGSGADQYTGGGDDSYDFAKGGAIPGADAPAFSGQVHPSMSPSGGRQVDDVRAQGPGGRPINLNAKEFVVPEDVATWKGHEFFQNLIDQSRKKRMGASAKPSVSR